MTTTAPSATPAVSLRGYAGRAESAALDAVAIEQYRVAIGYLRAFVTVLVVAHHAVLAYHPFAPASESLLLEPRWWLAFPVVDRQRWTGFTVFAGFNDIFFMSLMFFLSGLFVWPSLERKGSGRFLRDRGLRLGLPFVVAAAVLAPLAYYPAYLTRSAAPSVSDFWQQWLSLGVWPAGPAWFIWMLLTFDMLAALVKMGSGFFSEAATTVRAIASSFLKIIPTPILLIAVSALCYIPIVLAFGALHWTAVGPFTFQTSRVLHYLFYFAAGVVLGASGAHRGLLAPGGMLARRWPTWSIGAIVAFVIASLVAIAALQRPDARAVGEAVSGLTFVLSCAASSFALLALFLRFARSRTAMMDSLSRNAYGIYLVHYAAVSWLQYALLDAPISAVAKGTVVLAGALVISWALTAALRRIPAFARII